LGFKPQFGFVQVAANATILSQSVFCFLPFFVALGTRLMSARCGNGGQVAFTCSPRQFPMQQPPPRRANSKYTCERKYKLGIAARSHSAAAYIQMVRADNEFWPDDGKKSLQTSLQATRRREPAAITFLAAQKKNIDTWKQVARKSELSPHLNSCAVQSRLKLKMHHARSKIFRAIFSGIFVRFIFAWRLWQGLKKLFDLFHLYFLSKPNNWVFHFSESTFLGFPAAEFNDADDDKGTEFRLRKSVTAGNLLSPVSIESTSESSTLREFISCALPFHFEMPKVEFSAPNTWANFEHRVHLFKHFSGACTFDFQNNQTLCYFYINEQPLNLWLTFLNSPVSLQVRKGLFVRFTIFLVCIDLKFIKLAQVIKNRANQQQWQNYDCNYDKSPVKLIILCRRT
jgi:hypothetical protein